MFINSLFVDTAYVYALINPNDQWHGEAVEWQKNISSEGVSLITTQFILTEIADGLPLSNFVGPHRRFYTPFKQSID